MAFFCALWRKIRSIIYSDFPGEGSQTVRNEKLLLAGTAPVVYPELAHARSHPAVREQQHRLALNSEPSSASSGVPAAPPPDPVLVTAILLMSHPHHPTR